MCPKQQIAMPLVLYISRFFKVLETDKEKKATCNIRECDFHTLT